MISISFAATERMNEGWIGADVSPPSLERPGHTPMDMIYELLGMNFGCHVLYASYGPLPTNPAAS